MSKFLRDNRRSPLPTGPKVPGATETYTLNSSEVQSFTPGVSKVTLYEVRTNADIRIVAHDSSYTFVKADEPEMWAFETDYFELGPAGSHPRQTISFVGSSGAATVRVSEYAEQ